MNKRKILIAISILFIMNSCNDDETNAEMNNDSDNNNVSGTITLTGEETEFFGTTLVVRNILVNRTDLTGGVTNSVALLPENVTITDDDVIFDDPDNGFNLLGVDFSAEPVDIGKTIGLAIAKDGVRYTFFCDSPVTDGTGAIECGENYNIDFVEQKVTFDNTTVINVDSQKILTLDGIISWE